MQNILSLFFTVFPNPHYFLSAGDFYVKFPGLQNTFKQQNLFYNCIKSLNLVFVQLDLFQSQSNQSEYGGALGRGYFVSLSSLIMFSFNTQDICVCH